MKNIVRNAALALSVLSLGATVALPASGKMGMGIAGVNKCPVPTCPVSDPNGCGIYKPLLGSGSTSIDGAR